VSTSVFPDAESLSYVDLLSYIEEVNRCPGGKRTIRDIIVRSQIESGSRILEIGSNTGFTSIEIAKLKDCSITGIDVNSQAVKKSTEILQKEPKFIQDRVNFQVADASNLPFEDETFDLIVTGGANTFIPDEQRAKALTEYKRVLKPYGFLSVTNLFYNSKIPDNLLNKMSVILGFKVKPWTKYYWLKLLLNAGLELYTYEDKKMRSRPEKVVKDYVEKLVYNSPALENAPDNIKESYQEKWFNIMKVFNENHKYLSFMAVLLRKNHTSEQQELFIEEDVIDPWNIDGQNFW